MRYGVISDVHGNLPALEAALAVLEREGVDAYLHGGDLVGYGPFPNECVSVVSELGATGVAGNHDLIALDRLSTERCIPLARRTLEWTRSVLSEPVRESLAALPPHAYAGEILVAHGSIDDPQEYVRGDGQAEAQLERLSAVASRARLLILGHTHHPWAYDRRHGGRPFPRGGTISLEGGGAILLNPGSVGQSRDRAALARFSLVDLGRGTATFYAVPYAVDRTREELRRRGLPANACHLPPARMRWLRRTVRRLERAARHAAGRRRRR